MPRIDGVYYAPTGKWQDGEEPAIDANEMNAISDTLAQVPIANGGTGATTAAQARANLGLGNTSGALPVANGGTGATTVAQARNNLGLGNTSGALPIANGGTGQNGIVTQVITSNVYGTLTFHKWGKVVVCHYVSNVANLVGFTLGNVMPTQFRPSEPVYTVGLIYNSATSAISALPKALASVAINRYDIVVYGLDDTASTEARGAIRFTATWMTT